MFEKGTVYRLASGHYYFVITDPAQNTENVVVVNMTTHRGFPTEDHSCVLEENDHSAVRHRSWMKYEKAEIVSSQMLNQRFRTNVIAEVMSDK